MGPKTRRSDTWKAFVRAQRGHESRVSFAARAGISDSYVSNWENHGLVPRRETVIAAAQALGGDINAWLRAAGYDEEPQPDPAPRPVEETADQVGEDYVTYQAEVTVRRDTGDIVEIKRLPSRGRKRE